MAGSARPKLGREVALIVVVILAFALAYQGLKVVYATPIPIAVVEGNSMVPTLYEGDLVLIRNEGAERIHAAPKHASPPGDIIIFYDQRRSARIIHRAIAKAYYEGKWRFLTQGDNVALPDPGQNPEDPLTWVPEDRVLGKVVFEMPRVGMVTLFLRRNPPLLILLWLVAIAVLVTMFKEGKGGGKGVS